MFEPNPHCSSELSICVHSLTVKEGSRSVPNLFLIIKDFAKWRPLIWDLAVCMTSLWIINVGIDAPFEDALVGALGGHVAGCSGQMYVQEGGNVA